MLDSRIVRFDRQYAPEIRRIRHTVFSDEQGIDTALDFDGNDPDAVHVLVSVDGEAAATGRMLPDGHIGRLAVLKEHRGKGLGSRAVLALIDEAKRLGLAEVYLGSQMQAVAFYRRLGFSEHGQPFMEAGIEHIEMRKQTA